MNKDKNHRSPLDNPSLKKPVFQVPTDYFSQLEGKLMDRINAEEGELANAEHLKENIFKTPQGYFQKLEDRITQKLDDSPITLEGNEHLKTPVFKVPAGYFESLENSITEKLEAPSETRVIPLYRKKWFQIAAAAMLAVGIFFGTQGSNSGGITDGEIAGNFSNDLILDYLLEEPDYDYELMALSDDFEGIIDDILLDETFGLGFEIPANLELEYDFEYFEQ